MLSSAFQAVRYGYILDALLLKGEICLKLNSFKDLSKNKFYECLIVDFLIKIIFFLVIFLLAIVSIYKVIACAIILTRIGTNVIRIAFIDFYLIVFLKRNVLNHERSYKIKILPCYHDHKIDQKIRFYNYTYSFDSHCLVECTEHHYYINC